MKTQPMLNPMVFVKDENSPEFRAHIARRAKAAMDPKNRSKNLPVADAEALFNKLRKAAPARG